MVHTVGFDVPEGKGLPFDLDTKLEDREVRRQQVAFRRRHCGHPLAGHPFGAALCVRSKTEPYIVAPAVEVAIPRYAVTCGDRRARPYQRGGAPKPFTGSGLPDEQRD